MGGKPYVGDPPSGFLPKSSSSFVQVGYDGNKYGTLYLVDGDNHIYEGLSGIEHIGKEDIVLVFVTQKGLSNNLKSKYSDKIMVIPVKQVKQAVDNAIKSRLGNKAVLGRFSKVVVVSQDNGYKSQIEKANTKGRKRYFQVKSIKQALTKGE